VNFRLNFSGCRWFGFGWGDLAECAIAVPPYERRDNLCRIRRYRLPGGCYFFTVNLLERKNTLLVDRIDLLRESVHQCKTAKPFYIDAWVVLPEHMHTIWTLPEGDKDFSGRWKMIKTLFSKAGNNGNQPYIGGDFRRPA